MPKKSTKEKTADEIRLETILDHVCNAAVTVDLPAVVRERIAARLSIPHQDGYVDKLLIYDVVEFALCELMCRSLHGISGDSLLTGLIIIWIRNCDVTHRRCSMSDAYDALVDPYIAEKITNLLQRHNHLTARAVPVTTAQMHQVLDRLHGVHQKTAGRYEDMARTSVIHYLSDCLLDLCDLISPTPQPATQVTVQTNDLGGISTCRDLATLIQHHTQSNCAMSPSAYSISLPIADCVSRSVHIRGEPFTITTDYLANHLATRWGTIAGSPGMGVSTVMRQVALIGNRHNLYGCRYFYFSLPSFYQVLPEEGYSIAHYIASVLDTTANQNVAQYLELVAQIEDWLTTGRLVVLADDLERLDVPAQKAIIKRLAGVKAIYFAVSPWSDEVMSSMRQLFGSDLLQITVDSLDADTKELLVMAAARAMDIPYSAGSISGEFDYQNAVEAATPMGVLTALQTQIAPAESKHLIFAYTYLSEHLKRHGMPALCLSQQVSDLDAFALGLIRLGQEARESMMDYESEKLFDRRTNTRLTVPLSRQALESIAGVSTADLLRLRLLRPFNAWTGSPLLFVSPLIEELLMTLDCYYFRRCTAYLPAAYRWHDPRSWLGAFFAGVRSSVLRRVEQSSVLVPQLFR